MVQYQTARLDDSFAALSDPTRRGVLAQLGGADASISELAGRFHITLTGMKKHVGVLERAGLVTTRKIGRVRTCRLDPRGLEEAAAWIEAHQRLWDARFDALDEVVGELKRKEMPDERSKRRSARPDEEPHDGGADIGPRDGRDPNLRRPRARRVRGVDQA